LTRQDEKVIFDIENAAQQFAYVEALVPNQWTYVAGTLDDKTGAMRLYINGVQRASGVTSVRPLGPLDANSNPGLGIGNIQSGNYDEHFNGLIDEVRISDQALPASQLLSHASIPGDANRDGVVNFADLLILAQHYGTGAQPSGKRATSTGTTTSISKTCSSWPSITTSSPRRASARPLSQFRSPLSRPRRRHCASYIARDDSCPLSIPAGCGLQTAHNTRQHADPHLQ
jgi:hypothetical protein